jgi:hypothetical protein
VRPAESQTLSQRATIVVATVTTVDSRTRRSERSYCVGMAAVYVGIRETETTERVCSAVGGLKATQGPAAFSRGGSKNLSTNTPSVFARLPLRSQVALTDDAHSNVRAGAPRCDGPGRAADRSAPRLPHERRYTHEVELFAVLQDVCHQREAGGTDQAEQRFLELFRIPALLVDQREHLLCKVFG